MKTKLWTATALAAALTAMPAAALVVTGATSITITSAAPTYLQVAEVEAFNFASVDVAAAANGATAIGSSEYAPGSSTPGKAIDGNTGGNYYGDTIFHSAGAGANEFLTVDFAAANLSSLTIFGRTDCCSERDVYDVVITNARGATLYSGTLDASGASHSATVTFTAGSTVPEPASWALMIAGFGLVGVAARSRRRTTATA